jgi:hypothetical protein
VSTKMPLKIPIHWTSTWWLICSFHQGKSIFSPFSLGWIYDLLWVAKCGEDMVKSEESLSLNRIEHAAPTCEESRFSCWIQEILLRVKPSLVMRARLCWISWLLLSISDFCHVSESKWNHQITINRQLFMF